MASQQFGLRISEFGRTDMFLCSGCNQEFQANENADVQICPNCNQQPQSTRRVPKLKPGGDAKRYRIDNAHPVHKGDVEAGELHDSHELIQQVGAWVSVRSMNHAVVFGLFVFLLGQALHSWAFVAGNYLVWSLANLISVLGVSTALISIAITLRNLDKRIKVLAEAIPRRTTRRRSREPKKQFEKK